VPLRDIKQQGQPQGLPLQKGIGELRGGSTKRLLDIPQINKGVLRSAQHPFSLIKLLTAD